MAFQNAKLKINDTGEEQTLYWQGDGPQEGARDDKVQHNIPGRSGDIEQDMGRGSNSWSGTLMITDMMHSNDISGFKQFLLDAARTDGKLTYTDAQGTTYDAKMEEPEFDKSDLPNLLRADVTIRELDNPPKA